MGIPNKLRGLLSRGLPAWIPASENQYGIELYLIPILSTGERQAYQSIFN